jgi:hypothetical protein
MENDVAFASKAAATVPTIGIRFSPRKLQCLADDVSARIGRRRSW